MAEHKIQIVLKGYNGLTKEELEELLIYCYLIPARRKKKRHKDFITQFAKR